MTPNRRTALIATFLAVLVLAVGVPELLHLRGPVVPVPTGVSQSQPSAAYRQSAAGAQVLSV